MSKKKRKFRTSFRKNHESRTRDNNLTRKLQTDAETLFDAEHQQRVSGKGQLSRKRTIAGGEVVEDASGSLLLPEVDKTICQQGRVLRVQGLVSRVQSDDGTIYSCATRQILKQVATDVRHVVAAGDHVWFRPEGAKANAEGIIERVEPRHGVLSRTSRGRQHLIVVNVDQIVVIASAAEPRLKPNLIDRYLITCERTGIRPLICINKIDLVQPADLMPLVGVYAQLGYEVLLVSAETGAGIDRLRSRLLGKQNALTGQSGVGKSSLLNAVDSGLDLRVSEVSAETQKGRHTTTTAELFPLAGGGYVVDTPGIRQFQLWDVIPEEVAGYFRDIRPYVSKCRFPDCTHTHEEFCAVKDAVADGWIDTRRYESFVQISSGDDA